MKCQRSKWGRDWTWINYALTSPLAAEMAKLEPGQTWDDGNGNVYRKMEDEG